MALRDKEILIIKEMLKVLNKSIKGYRVKISLVVISSRRLSMTGISRVKPCWITGFTESDGSFMVNVVKKKGGLGVDLIPTYTLSQKIIDKSLMEEIKRYFGVGQVYTSRSECNFTVKGNRQLREVIIPHFERYQLRGEKG